MDIAAERAYPTPIANSPLLPLLLISLATQRNAPKQAKTIKDEYDYIVVGGGSAGSVVASRLSEEPCVTVLLLEAGAKNPPLINDIPGLGRYFWNTDIDWQFKTVPQKKAAFFHENQQVIWPSGKGLGGSSLLNAMLYVRGNRKDYDDWEAQGAKGWGFKDVFPYFLKLEDNQDQDFLANGYHASGGPIAAEKPRYEGGLKSPIREAAQQLGYKILDSNAQHQTGFNDYQANTRNGQRCSTAKAYLVPAENRTNLDIIGGAYAKKVLFDGNRAVGVQFDYKNSTYEVKARREVILSAGTTNTAQLLMLSGIGPRKHLQKFNIPVIADLPVGDNFQDHCGFPMPFVLNEKPLKEKLKDPENIKEYINNRTGPLASPELVSTMAFLNDQVVSPEEDFPDHELYFLEISKEIVKEQVGLDPLIYRALFFLYENGPMFVCVSHLLHPKSKGTVRLQSSDPYDPPLIDPNYFDDPADVKAIVKGTVRLQSSDPYDPPLIDPNYFDDPTDVKAIVKGMETCRKIGLSKPMKKAGVRPFATILPWFTNWISDLDGYFTQLATSVVVTLSHQVGTAKMGDPKDPTTVVDPQLRVKGIRGLRVADASVMPIVPSGNTNIPTIMIAEKASDIIKESIWCPSG